MIVYHVDLTFSTKIVFLGPYSGPTKVDSTWVRPRRVQEDCFFDSNLESMQSYGGIFTRSLRRQSAPIIYYRNSKTAFNSLNPSKWHGRP